MANNVQQDRVQLFVEVNGKQVKNTLKDIKAEYRSILRTRERLQVGSEEYKKQTAEANRLLAIINQQRRALNGVGQEAKKVKQETISIKGQFSKLGGVIKGALVAGGIIGLLDNIVRIGQEVFNVSQEFQELREDINQVSGETGDSLSEIVAQVKALDRTFEEVSAEQVITAANVASRAWGQDFGETTDLIEKGLLAVNGKGDEFLDQVSEYSVQLKQAGLTAEESFSVIASSINQGVFSDKGADAIKEFNLRIKDLSTGQRKILDDTLGKGFTENLVTGIETGSKSAVEALGDVGKELGKFGADSAATQKVISSLFGGPGEDAGADFIISLQNVNGSIEDLIDTGNVYVARQIEQLELEKELAAAQEELSFALDGTSSGFARVTTAAKTLFFEGLVKLTEFVGYFPDQIKVMTSSWQAFANSLISGFETIGLGLPIINKLLGTEYELPKFTVPEATLEAERELQEKIDADRTLFAEDQERKALAAQKKESEALRLQAIREQKRTDAAMQKAVANAQNKIEDLRLAVMADGVEKRIKLAELAAAREIKKLKGSASQIAEQRILIEEKLAQDIVNIKETEAKRIRAAEEEAAEKATKAQNTEFDKRIEGLERYNDQRILEITQAALAEAEAGTLGENAEKDVQERLLAQLRTYLDKRRDLLQEFGEETTEVDQQIADLQLEQFTQQSAARQKATDEIFEGIAKAAELTGQAVGALSNLVAAKSQARYDEQVEALEAAQENELKAAGNNAKKREAIEEKFQQRRDQLDLEFRKKEQKRAVATSIIDTLAAAVKALATPPAPNFFAAATTAAFGALQTAAMASKKFEKGDLLIGPRHSAGGIKLVDGNTGQLVGEAEGGEPLLSRATYANNRAIVDRLLYAGKYQGGAPIFESGGVIGQDPLPVPSDQAVEVSADRGADVALMQEISGLRQDLRQVQFVSIFTEKEADSIKSLMDDLDSRRSSGKLN